MGVRQQKKAERRRAIDEAALAILLQEGFDRCSVERITATVGIARGTFYLYYPDKLALFERLCDRLYGPLVAVLELAASDLRAAATPLEQQVRYLRMAGELTAAVEAARPLMMLHFREHRSAGPSGAVVARWSRRIEDLAAGILRDARDRGLTRDVDPTTTALAIVGAGERLAWAWLTGDPRVDRERVASELAAVFWQGISRTG
jgi:AcrR family transcriptional regulator